jgi:ribonuclease BN (tRNA processing enzyme)
VPLWLPPGGREFLRRVAAAFAEPKAAPAFFSTVFDVAEYDPAQPLPVGDARLAFAPTVHYVSCWAIRVASPDTGGDLVFTGDTGPAAGLDAFAAGAAVLVAEASSLEPDGAAAAERGHLTAREAAELANLAGVGTLVLVHLWEEYGFDSYRREATAVFPGRVEIGRPGLCIEW